MECKFSCNEQNNLQVENVMRHQERTCSFRTVVACCLKWWYKFQLSFSRNIATNHLQTWYCHWFFKISGTGLSPNLCGNERVKLQVEDVSELPYYKDVEHQNSTLVVMKIPIINTKQFLTPSLWVQSDCSTWRSNAILQQVARKSGLPVTDNSYM